MINFILLNLAAGLSAVLISKYFFAPANKADYFISLFIVFLSQVIVSLLILGIAGKLYLVNLLILNLLFAFVLWMIIMGLKLKWKTPHSPDVSIGGFTDSKVQALCLAAVIAFAISKIMVNLANPPFGWDSLNYHFTFPVEWFKHGNLNTPITIFDDPSPTYYPINGSLFYLWLIMPFRSVFLADLGQLPFFIIAVISVYSIAQRIGLNKTNSFYSAVLFALIPNFFKQLQIAYVDVMVGALFLVCVNYLLVLKRNFTLRNVLIYSLSLGLLIGTKTTALPFSILLIIPFLVMLFKNYKKAYFVFIPVFCVLTLGGFSYFRNFMQTGNPLYPLDFSLFNIHIFHGVMDKTIYSSYFSGSDYSLGKMLFHEGLGAQALFLILPGMFLALPVAFFKKRRDLNFNQVFFLLLPLLIYFVYRYIIPLANVRYLYAMMGLGVILGFYLLELLKARKWLINILVILCVFSSIPSLAKKQELVASIILLVFVFFILVNFKKTSVLVNKRIWQVIIIALTIGVLFWAQGFYKANEFPRYYKMVKYSGFWPEATKAWDWLNNETVGNNIAYTGRAVPFPLYGSNLKNNVYYVSVNRTQPAKLHYFNNSKYEYGPGFESLLKSIEQENNYRGNADYNIWLENLLKANTDYLFVYSLQQTKSTIFPMEDSWAITNTDKFKPVFTNNTIHIYKIIK